MKQHSQHRSSEEQQQTTTGQTSQPSAALEFESVEQMLRHDALHTPVPPTIADRLKESIGPARAARPWWRRLFGKAE